LPDNPSGIVAFKMGASATNLFDNVRSLKTSPFLADQVFNEILLCFAERFQDCALCGINNQLPVSNQPVAPSGF
jgi:hypothetical protein